MYMLCIFISRNIVFSTSGILYFQRQTYFTKSTHKTQYHGPMNPSWTILMVKFQNWKEYFAKNIHKIRNIFFDKNNLPKEFDNTKARLAQSIRVVREQSKGQLNAGRHWSNAIANQTLFLQSAWQVKDQIFDMIATFKAIFSLPPPKKKKNKSRIAKAALHILSGKSSLNVNF